MEFHAPVWYLKEFCGDCEQGSCLTLVACPSCSHIAIICAECGAIFPNGTQIKVQDRLANEAVCPNCQKVRIADFRAANSNQIQAAGLLKGQYQ